MKGCEYEMKFILVPCLYVYRTISYILKLIIRFFKDVILGFLSICYGIGSFIFHIFIGIAFIFEFIRFSIFGSSETAEVRRVNKEEKKKRDQVEKARVELEKKNKAEQAMIKKLNAAEEKKRRANDVYINPDAKKKKLTFADMLDSLFSAIGSVPIKINKSIKKSIDNSYFVRSAKNKRDINRQALLLDFNGEDAKKSKVKVVYEYEALNPEGKIVRGYFEAFSKVEVHSFLLSEGNTVYSIKTNRWIQMLHGNRSEHSGKIRTKDLIFMLAQLSTYLKAGIPLIDSIKILVRQFKNKNYERILRGVVYDLSSGESLSEAMLKQGNAFPRLLINMIKTSEMTGELPEVLDEMEEYYTETEATRKAMVTAMMYPMIIFFVALAVGTFIMIYVVPQFVEIYENMDGAEIPGITIAVLAFSEFLQKNLIWLILGLIGVILVILYLYKNVKSFRAGMQYTLMHIPVIGNVIIYNEVTMFAKTFSSLLSHNVFITDSMDILNRITNNEIYKMLILDTITNLAKGEKVSESFRDQWAFPLPAYEMIVTGEKTGQLSEMMTKVAAYYQDLHKNAVTRIKTFVEPIMILMLTAIVGVIVLSIVVPMFNMYDAIQQ